MAYAGNHIGWIGGDGSYDMPAKVAIERLLNAKIQAGVPPFYGLEVKAQSVGEGVVIWSGKGSHASIMCEAKIAETEDKRSMVTQSCNGGGPSDGAAAGITSDMINVVSQNL